jgi:multiple sugar transport system ATP-binding protein
VRRTPKAEARRRVEEVAALLGLDELLDRRPAQLSGGQRQRVAMGRAIVREPKAFLMDEPLSNLDAKLRVGMRASLAQLHARLGVTTVYVTHDQTEAMTLGQRVAVLNEGRVLQCDRPQRLYDRPANVFVAAFIGTPPMNLVEASVQGDEVAFGEFRLRLDAARRPKWSGGNVILGIRPEAFVEAGLERGLPTLTVTPSVVEELGSEAHIFFPVQAAPVLGDVLEKDEETTLLPESKALFAARVDPATPARVGVPLELAVNPRRLHFFDPRTGASLAAEPEPETAPAEELAAAP